MNVCSGCPGGWCAGCVPVEDEMLKRFHVRIWDDLSDPLPIEDEMVEAQSHVEAVQVAFFRLRLSSADWVQVDEQAGETMKFLDVFVSGRSIQYEVSYP